MTRTRIAALLVGLMVAVSTGVAARSSVSTAVAARASPSEWSRTVPCNEVASMVRLPFRNGYRLVLGVVSVPPAYLPRAVPSGLQPFRYWLKAGLVVVGRAPVSVSVPEAWQRRVAITWGNASGTLGSVRIAGCGWSPYGRGYAGGFYLSSRSACFPLIFRAGQRSATVRFGVGRTCAGAG